MFRRLYELRAGEELLATVESRALFNSAAVATTASGRSLLRHAGLFRGNVLLSAEDAGTPRITFHPGWVGKGIARCASGRELRWKRADFWGRAWRFEDASELGVLSFVRGPTWFRTAVSVEPSEAARALPELTDLTLLGFYLLLLMQRQAHAAAS
ncbi:MAG: hypothetical protein ABIU54_13040 [Candidatus Eisenbacteria bacterium]